MLDPSEPRPSGRADAARAKARGSFIGSPHIQQCHYRGTFRLLFSYRKTSLQGPMFAVSRRTRADHYYCPCMKRYPGSSRINGAAGGTLSPLQPATIAVMAVFAREA